MSNAVATISQDIYGTRDSFASVLTDRSLNFEREAEFAIQTITANDYSMKLAVQNRQSVVNAVTNIAAIGISLNPAKKQAYLVPRDGKICLDISYIGLMDLAMNTGAIRWAQSELVYTSDNFALNGFDKPPTHSYNPFSKDRGEVIGVYVVVKTSNGDYLTETMSVDEVNAIRDRSSAWKAWISKQKSCPWVTDWGEMAKKTCVKRAYKYWPKTERLEEAIHYLNTEGNEGLSPINGKPQADADLAQRWIDQAVSCQSVDALQQIWQAGLADIKAARDMAAYSQFKAQVEKRRAELLELEPVTLEGEPQ
ncbi:recombinase RecT [Pseudomonas mosselii]|uniref:recombinase RecT n=1 Tax=Pseudomonas mosselii TaxID=78327 RepID=UPI0021D9A291|nr:recombinase RecT [Pseudomonas mosselii]MCU9528782.1 recombinase RecT [Pseudomonas mosselii]MCU9536117.1 recombinase RecT [Pseudomonas mosselii]MCU9541752.1 recombinase RecT [Pseudomonas mosselii]MCU9547711.1 recombinase RecT [Pseudomonas mosselii]